MLRIVLIWLCALGLAPAADAYAQTAPGQTPATAPASPSKPPSEPAPPAAKPDAAAPAPKADAEAKPAAPAPAPPPPAAPEAPPSGSSEAEAPAAAPEQGEAAGSTETGSDAPEAVTPSPEVTAAESEAVSAEPEPEIPSPGEIGDRLASPELPEAVVVKEPMAAPTPVFTLHGYLRTRGEMLDKFWLGRAPIEAFGTDSLEQVPPPDQDARDLRTGQGPDPFSRYRSVERSQTGACPDEGTTNDLVPTLADDVPSGYNSVRTCDVDTVQHANMRLRLSPTLNVSEDVRVRATFDVFDNLVWGTPTDGWYGSGPFANTAFASTSVPPEKGGLSDSIVARRAWAEVRNRDLGELRFGRMPMHWGAGMIYNSGDGLDQDFSTDMDRVVAITKLIGFYLSASYDFAFEGVVENGNDRPALDESQIDDLSQFTFSAAYMKDEEVIKELRERGAPVVNFGVQFQLRDMDGFYNAGFANDGDDDNDNLIIQEADSTYYTTDFWAEMMAGPLRLEAEIAFVLGQMDNGSIENPQRYDIGQFGYVLESELRFFDEKLGIYFYQGFASGDSDVEGVSSDANYVEQLSGDDTVSTFRFNPSYQVDLILWRNIMRQVTGAYYFKPGISYDFLKGDFGQLLGARFDLIYSRAASMLQTWGNDPNLGVELDLAIYWRSEDGAEMDDGYHAALQYGALFPLQGLGYRHDADTDLDVAQMLRVILGVVY